MFFACKWFDLCRYPGNKTISLFYLIVGLTLILPNSPTDVRRKNLLDTHINITDVLKLRMKIGEPFPIKLHGVSMQPVLWDGELIRIQPQKRLNKGDIALFTYHNEGEIVHRIISITESAFYCKGDNAFRIEEVPPSCMIGKVVGRYSGQGWSSCDFRFHTITLLVCYLSRKIHQQSIEANWIVSRVKKRLPYKFLQWLLKQRIFYSKEELS